MLFYRFVFLTGWLPAKLVFRPKYYYEDRKSQSRSLSGKAILMPNHHSIWDFAAMLFAFPTRNLHCVVGERIYQRGFYMRWFMKLLGSIPVDRAGADFTFVSKACGILARKGVVEIYPEARLPRKGEATPLPFKESVASIALESLAPIVPVVTNGKYFSASRLRILIGRPIDVCLLYRSELSQRENIRNITHALRERMIDLQAELQRRIAEEG